MLKKDFLDYLKEKLKRFKREDINEAVAYYDELISDKMENEGFDEATAVQSLGNPDVVAKNIATDMVANGKATGVKGAIAVLAICSTPILIPLASGIFAIYVAIIAVWFALMVASGCCAFASFFAIIMLIFDGGFVSSDVFYIGLCIVLGALLVYATYLLAKYGAKLINMTTVGLAKTIKRRLKK